MIPAIPGHASPEVIAMNQDLPQGLGLALSQRPEAMERFAALPAQSKQEMRACVDRLMG